MVVFTWLWADFKNHLRACTNDTFKLDPSTGDWHRFFLLIAVLGSKSAPRPEMQLKMQGFDFDDVYHSSRV